MNKNHSGSDKNSEKQDSDNNLPVRDTKLILFNDDVNEFIYVIESIIDIIHCDEQQAEQLTLLAHHKGSITIKEGSFEFLSQLSELFKKKGLKSAVLQNGN